LFFSEKDSVSIFLRVSLLLLFRLMPKPQEKNNELKIFYLRAGPHFENLLRDEI